MRIGFVTWSDPENVKSFSGTHRLMLRALREYGHNVQVLGPLNSPWLTAGKIANRILKKTTGHFLDPTHTWMAANDFARSLQRKLKGEQLDVLFAPAASTAFVRARLNLPVVYYTDATFRLIQKSYGFYSRMFDFSRKSGEEIEKYALRTARFSIFPSHWAAQSALHDYGVPAERVGVVPMGANLEKEPTEAEALRDRGSDTCQLLFVGVWWERKGGDIALETLRALRAQGVPAQLTVCGCTPTETDPHMEVIPYLNKAIQADAERLASLFLRSHFFLLPTRADAFPMVLSEASAYGLINLSTDVGGVSEIVVDGVTGILFSLDARGPDYAKAAADLWANAKQMEKMRAAARTRYLQTLRWSSWASAITAYFDAANELSNEAG